MYSASTVKSGLNELREGAGQKCNVPCPLALLNLVANFWMDHPGSQISTLMEKTMAALLTIVEKEPDAALRALHA